MKKMLKCGKPGELTGDTSKLRGDVSGISGDVSGLTGDLADCKLTAADREKGVDISELVK